MLNITTFCTYPLYMPFIKALSETGNFVRTYNINTIPNDEHYEHIKNIFKEKKPDIVLTIGRPNLHVNLDALVQLCEEESIMHVYWATEDRTYHQNHSLKIAQKCDYILTPAAECIESYNKIGKKAYLMQYGCHPHMHRRRQANKSYETDITIAASYHDGMKYDSYIRKNVLGKENDNEKMLRKESIEKIVIPLVEKGYRISIWGLGWKELIPEKYLKGLIPYYNIPILYSSSKIVLGLEWDDISETKTTGRPFEALCSKSLFLSYRTKALSNLFKEKKHLLLSSSKDETISLINYFLKKTIERQKIAEHGFEEVVNKHTYHIRAQRFIKEIKNHL